MPLLKGRFEVSLYGPVDIKPNEASYTIKHTGEQFKSKDLYEEQLAFYNENIWTCRLTGHINLTHEEAWQSEKEKREQLKTLPAHFEKPVLEFVHHNAEVLDVIVDKAWTVCQKSFMIDEPVLLKVKAGGKTISGNIIKIDEVAEETNLPGNSNCNSPQSDKENKNKDANKTELGRSPSKYTPIKMLPHKYSFKLEDQEKIIKGVPAEDLMRQHKHPSKELIKLYIRNCSLRGGMSQTSPYVVDKNLVKKYNLKGKYAEMFFSPEKVAEAAKKSIEEARAAAVEKKKRLSNVRALGASKKLKSEKKVTKPPKGQPRLNFKSAKAKKPSNNESPQKRVVSIDSENESNQSSVDSDVPLSVIRNSPRKTPKKTSPKKKMKKELSTPNKKSSRESMDIDSDDSDIALIKLKSPTKCDKSSVKKLTSAEANKIRGRPRGSPNKRPKGSLAADKKKMKQITLFDMKGKIKQKNASNSPQKSPTKSPKKKKTPYKQPPLVIRLQRNFLQNPQTKGTQKLALRCAKELKKNQLGQLPPDIKDLVMMKWTALEERKKIEKMTPEEKEKYMLKKRKEAQEKALAKNKKVEDSELVDLKPLPQPKLVSTPDGLPNELFGDVVMVTEFISCYKGLLMGKDDEPLCSDELMNALVSGKDGFTFLGKVISVLLQTLFQDVMSSGYKELDTHLSKIPSNQFTASELVRLCLHKKDEFESVEDDEEEYGDHDDDESVAEIVDQLDSCELYMLNPEEKLQILKGLCHRIMGSYKVQDYMSEKQAEATELWKKNSKVARLQLKEEKEKKKAENIPVKEEMEESDCKKEVHSSIAKFYGIKEEDMNNCDDMASVVKKRRVMAAKAAAEREVQQRELRSAKQKEMEEEQQRRERIKMTQDYVKGQLLAKLVQRQSPIGTDRDHSRYWIFHKTTHGLYIEKGWAPKEINYCAQKGNIRCSKDDSDSGSSSDSDDENKSKRGRPSKKVFIQKSMPHIGQNLWFTIEDPKDVQELYNNLHPKGIRESELKVKLEDQLERLLAPQNKIKVEKEDEKELGMVDGLREELGDLELRVRNGGLGGVEDFKTWETRLNTSQEIQDFGNLLKETQENVLEKFYQGHFTKKVKKRKVKADARESDEDMDVDKELNDSKEEGKEDDMVSINIKRWQDEVNNANTWSRLHVLMGILESCIKWEKSAENAKCKICRKKGDESRLLLCDECNGAFHMYCMRPAMYDVPQGDWFCPGCAPTDRHRSCRATNFRVLADVESEEDEDQDGEIEHEEECAVCGERGIIAECSTCVSVFHYDCHDPPLRHAPRTIWRCMQCTTGVRIRKSSRRTARQKRSYKYDSDDYESEPPAKRSRTSRNSSATRAASSNRSSGRNTRRNYAEDAQVESSESSNDEDTEEDGEEESSEGEPDESDEVAYTSSGRAVKASQISPALSHNNVAKGAQNSTNSQQNGKKRLSQNMCNGVPSLEEELKHVEDIISRLRRNRFAWPFQDPVDKNTVPDYFEIVKSPIDLLTMKQKCTSKEYKNASEFVSDVALMFDNAQLYNKPDSQVGRCVAPLEKQFCELLSRSLPHCEYSRACSKEGKDTEMSPSKTISDSPNDSNRVQIEHAYC